MPVIQKGLNKTEAEDVLDWLESQGIKGGQLAFCPYDGYSICHRTAG
jgi:hypothetical protein